MSERRDSHRYPVRDDRAHVTIVVDREPYPAVLADMSASGFAVLALRGAPLKAAQNLMLIVGEDTFECQVAYTVPDDTFQRVGLRRVRDILNLTMPEPKYAKSYFKDTLSSGNPLLIFGVILGFTGLLIGVLSAAGIGGGGGKSRPQPAAYASNVRDAVSDAESTDVVQAGRRFRDESVAKAKETIESVQQELADALLAKQDNAAAKLVGSGDTSWAELVKKLGLSKSQQRQMLAALDEPLRPSDSIDPVNAATTSRDRALDVLTEKQKAQFAQLLATGPF